MESGRPLGPRPQREHSCTSSPRPEHTCASPAPPTTRGEPGTTPRAGAEAERPHEVTQLTRRGWDAHCFNGTGRQTDISCSGGPSPSNQGPRTQTGPPTWRAGTWVPEPSAATSQGARSEQRHGKPSRDPKPGADSGRRRPRLLTAPSCCPRPTRCAVRGTPGVCVLEALEGPLLAKPRSQTQVSSANTPGSQPFTQQRGNFPNASAASQLPAPPPHGLGPTSH